MGDAGTRWPLFLCYRRSDSEREAKSLQQALDTIFGPGTVFRDEASVEHGTEWPGALRDALTGARALLVVIGPDWLVADPFDFNRGVERRIDRPQDWVRREIEDALGHGILIYPVLVRGAAMPPPEALPLSIEKIAHLQAMPFDSQAWSDGQEQLAATLETALGLRRHGAAGALPAARRNDPLVPYRKHLRSRHQYLVTFPGPRTPLLSEVYVEVAVDPQRWGQYQGNLEEAGAKADGFGWASSLTLRQLLERTGAAALATPTTRAAPASASPAAREQKPLPRHWVLLGEPGSGKSTVLRHLCWQLASDDAPDGAPIPIYVSLAAWAIEDRPPWQLAEEDLRSTAGDEAAAGLASALLTMVRRDLGASSRAVWLLLDGLDEVAPERMPTVRDRIKALLGLCAGAQVVVSSRGIGFRALGPDFGQAQLRPLDSQQQGRLLENWVGKEKAATIRCQVESRPALRPLLANPLQLTMVACLALEAPELPVNRTRLYQRALLHLIRKPWGPQDLTIDAPTEAMRVLEDLALALQRRDGVLWSKATLVALLKELGADVSPWRTRDGFLDQVAQRTGILAPFDEDDAWRFQHRQLRELLVAQALLRKEKDGGHWENEVWPLDAKQIPSWSEVLGAFCALTKDPMQVLGRLVAVDIGATVRALRAVEGVPPLSLLDFVWAQPDRGSSANGSRGGRHNWDGDDLRRLVLAWVAQGDATKEELRDWLYRQTGPELDLERLAYLYFALVGLGESDRATWFQRAGRVVPTQGSVEWLSVPAGEFDMGSPKTECERLPNEGPQRRVVVGSFQMARKVVTRSLYASFATPSLPKKDNVGDHSMVELGWWETWICRARVASKVVARRLCGIVSMVLLRKKDNDGEHPKVDVSWWEAWLFCSWLGARLPTEAEWEYVCRAGTTTPFSFGSNITSKEVSYNGNFPYAGGKKGNHRGRPVATGSLPANGWGVFEMHGNVWEWCWDWLGDYEKAPSDGSAQQEDQGSGQRVLRGGSWNDRASSCRSASRFGRHPGVRLGDVGFRPARPYP